MAMAVVVGLGAGLGAVAFIKTIELMAFLVEPLQRVRGFERLWVMLTLPAAIWLSWWFANRLAPETSGHGVPQIMTAIALRGGQIRARVAPLKVVLSGLTIGAGGSAG